MRLAEHYSYDVNDASLDRSPAEKMVLLYIDLATRVKKQGKNEIVKWLTEGDRPLLMKLALNDVAGGAASNEILEKYADQLKSMGSDSTGVLEILVAAEGAALVASEKSPACVFEYLASLFGEDYQIKLKTNLKNLYNNW